MAIGLVLMATGAALASYLAISFLLGRHLRRMRKQQTTTLTRPSYAQAAGRGVRLHVVRDEPLDISEAQKRSAS